MIDFPRYKNDGPLVLKKRGGKVPMWDPSMKFPTVMEAEEFVRDMNHRDEKNRETNLKKKNNRRKAE